MKILKEVFQFLKYINQRTLFLIIFFIFFQSLLELVGIGIFIPLLENLSGSDERILQFDFLKKYYFQNINFILLIIGIFFILKTCYILSIVIFTENFYRLSKKEIVLKLLNYYLHRPLDIHFKFNSNELLSNIENEVNLVILRQLSAFVGLIVEFMLIIVLSFFLFYLSFDTTFAVFLFFSSALLIYIYLTKKTLNQWGKERIIYQKLNYRNLSELFRGMKEIHVFDIQKYLKNKFFSNFDKLQKILRNEKIVGILPKQFLEIIAIFSFIIIVIVIYNKTSQLSETLVFLGIYAIASFKMIPAFSRIIYFYQSLSYSNSSLKLILRELKDAGEFQNKKLSKQNIQFDKDISINDLSYKTDKNIYIFKNFNLNFKSNSIVGIKGETGSGKTTLVEIILGMRSINHGEILIDEKKFISNQHKLINASYCPQNIFLIDGNIRENIIFDESNFDETRYRAILKIAELNSYIESLPEKDFTQIGEIGNKISGGQKQRIGIARALYKEAKLIIFDESTNALDNETEYRLIQNIRKISNNKLIIIISHNEVTLKNCDVIFNLNNRVFN